MAFPSSRAPASLAGPSPKVCRHTVSRHTLGGTLGGNGADPDRHDAEGLDGFPRQRPNRRPTRWPPRPIQAMAMPASPARPERREAWVPTRPPTPRPRLRSLITWREARPSGRCLPRKERVLHLQGLEAGGQLGPALHESAGRGWASTGLSPGHPHLPPGYAAQQAAAPTAPSDVALATPPPPATPPRPGHSFHHHFLPPSIPSFHHLFHPSTSTTPPPLCCLLPCTRHGFDGAGLGIGDTRPGPTGSRGQWPVSICPPGAGPDPGEQA